MRAALTSIAGLVLLIGTPLSAQEALETRILPAETESPDGDINNLGWMVGSWQGEGVGGARAMESWTAPVGGTMVGTFIQTKNDGTINFTELMLVRSVEGSLEMALKHFNPDMTGWEEKDEVERFRLVALEECAVFFQGLTVRCADREKPGEGLVVAVRAGKDKAGNVREFVFRYRAAPGSSPLSYNCDGTTIAINQCLAAVRTKAEAREKRYFAAALGEGAGSEDGESKLHALMRASQAAAEEQRKQECNAVYEFWKSGTIRNAMSLRCEIRLIDQRTHDIWRNWLTFQDSSAPILPEPGPSF